MAKRQKSKPNNSFGPFYLIGAGILIVTGVLIWQAISAAPSSTTPSAFGDIPFPSIERISIADARSALDNGEAVFVDVRDSSSYQAKRIPGAINIDLSQFEARYSELSKESWIILYCT